MTAPDPIREALEAAASSLRRPWPSFPTRGMTAEQQRQRAHEMAAAATIAAFLRALPPCDVMMQRWTNDNPPQQDGPHSTITLAAAVSAAAEGE